MELGVGEGERMGGVHLGPTVIQLDGWHLGHATPRPLHQWSTGWYCSDPVPPTPVSSLTPVLRVGELLSSSQTRPVDMVSGAKDAHVTTPPPGPTRDWTRGFWVLGRWFGRDDEDFEGVFCGGKTTTSGHVDRHATSASQCRCWKDFFLSFFVHVWYALFSVADAETVVRRWVCPSTRATFSREIYVGVELLIRELFFFQKQNFLARLHWPKDLGVS